MEHMSSKQPDWEERQQEEDGAKTARLEREKLEQERDQTSEQEGNE